MRSIIIDYITTYDICKILIKYINETTILAGKTAPLKQNKKTQVTMPEN
jgi:hypothetical protein